MFVQMLSQRRITRLASAGAGVMLWIRLRLKAVSRMSESGWGRAVQRQPEARRWK